MTADMGVSLYLDLMQRCLTDTLESPEDALAEITARGGRSGSLPGRMRRFLVNRLNRRGVLLFRHARDEARWLRAQREEGRTWRTRGETMVGLKRLDNVRVCIESVLRDGIPGDMVETGVWRGGAVIFMRAVLKAYGVTDRVVWVADSFQGLPAPKEEQYPADRGARLHTVDDLRVSEEQVAANFAKYGLLDDQVRFLKGWFHQTLPTARIQTLAVMRLDGDMYESTITALEALFPRLSVGGYVIVDDYGSITACKQAVHDYRARLGITDPIVEIDWTGVYWRKTGA